MDYISTTFTPDNLTLIISNLILVTLFIICAYFGSRLKWYQDLEHKDPANTYLLAGLWILFSLLSYISLYLISDMDENIYGQSRLIIYFVITNLLNLLWVVIFYVYMEFLVSIIIVLFIILINFYVILFLLSMNIWAGLLYIPLEALYIYLLYSFINLASKNGIVI